MFRRLSLAVAGAFLGGMMLFGTTGTSLCQELSGTESDIGFTEEFPTTPPGFRYPPEIGSFEASDHSDVVQPSFPEEDVEYSGVWNLVKRFDKPWKEMRPNERRVFQILADAVKGATTYGVATSGGTIEFKYNKDQTAFSGEWKKYHPKNLSQKLWWVRVAVYQESPADGIPFISIHISHTRLRKKP